MSVITLRGLAPEARKRIRRDAQRSGKSMNRFLVELIERHVVGPRRDRFPEHDDLDDLIGSMSQGDADAIESAVAEQRTIEGDLWS